MSSTPSAETAEADPAAPARAAARLRALAFGLRLAFGARRGWHLSPGPAALVDPVGLFSVRHPAGYGSHRSCAPNRSSASISAARRSSRGRSTPRVGSSSVTRCRRRRARRRSCWRRSRRRSSRSPARGSERSASGFRRCSTGAPAARSARSTSRSRTSRLHDLLGERFGIPVAVENDANVAALAEWKLGAGRGAENLVLLTLGTGVGGGVIMDGALYRGWAELGHVVVVADGPPCQGTCTGRGHLEAVASGNAADRAAREALGRGSDRRAPRGAGGGRRFGGARGAGRDRPSARRGDRLVHQRLRAGAHDRRRRLRDRGVRVPVRPRPTRSPGERRSSPRARASGSSRPSSAPTRG